MGKTFRKTIDFHWPMLNAVLRHSRKRGCGTFAEAVRDIIRLYFDGTKDSKKNNEKQD
jgi:hypothetical protein